MVDIVNNKIVGQIKEIFNNGEIIRVVDGNGSSTSATMKLGFIIENNSFQGFNKYDIPFLKDKNLNKVKININGTIDILIGQTGIYQLDKPITVSEINIGQYNPNISVILDYIITEQ